MKKVMYAFCLLLLLIVFLVTNIEPTAVASNSCGSVLQDCYPRGTNRCYRAPDGTLCMKNLAAD